MKKVYYTTQKNKRHLQTFWNALKYSSRCKQSYLGMKLSYKETTIQMVLQKNF